jgi:hypothetical protein
MRNTVELFTTTLRTLAQIRHLATKLPVIVLAIFSLALPSKADIINTYTLSPGATFNFEGDVEAAAGSITIDTYTFLILGGSITLIGPSPEAGTYTFDGVDGVAIGSKPSTIFLITTEPIMGQSSLEIENLFLESDASSLPFSVGGTTDATFDLTASVPEPTTWAMMIIGIVGLGFMAYQRKQNSATSSYA